MSEGTQSNENEKIGCAILGILTILAMMPTAMATEISYRERFIPEAIDGTTRWGAPLKYNESEFYPVITSKWNECRNVGSSPHVGIDLTIQDTNVVIAVADGILKKDTSTVGAQYNTVTLNTMHPTKDVYCHYEHCDKVCADGVRQKGDIVGIAGEYGAPGQPHLHFAAYSTDSISTRQGYRNETLYRDASAWNYGRNCDTFSWVAWNDNTRAQVTLVFSGKGNPHNEKPHTAQIYYRIAGETSWIGPFDMTNSGASDDFIYSYDFANVVPSGTRIEWVVRYRRSAPADYMWAPAKFYNPHSDPNGSTKKWAFVTNTVIY